MLNHHRSNKVFGWVTELFRIFVCMSRDSDLSIQFFTTINIKKKINQSINQSYFNRQAPGAQKLSAVVLIVKTVKIWERKKAQRAAEGGILHSRTDR